MKCVSQNFSIAYRIYALKTFVLFARVIGLTDVSHGQSFHCLYQLTDICGC